MSSIQQQLRKIRLLRQPDRDRALDLLALRQDVPPEQSLRIIDQISDSDIKDKALLRLIKSSVSVALYRRIIDLISDPAQKSHALGVLSKRKDLLSVTQARQILNQIPDPYIKSSFIGSFLLVYKDDISVAQARQLANQIIDPAQKSKALFYFAFVKDISVAQLRQISNHITDPDYRPRILELLAIRQQRQKDDTLLDRYKNNTDQYKQSQDVQKLVQKQGKKIPTQFYDPIFAKLMANPITLKDGKFNRTYQYGDIRTWWERGDKKFPQSREPLPEPKQQNINKELKEKISKYRKQVLGIPPTSSGFMERGPIRRAVRELLRGK